MTDRIKISASLQDAEAYMAECLEFVTQDEPFVLDFNDSYGSYVQAVRDDFDQICVEISGPESIEGELAPEVAAKLVKLGWGLPRQHEADTPNFWREYPDDVDLEQIAKEAIIGVAVAFPDAKFSGSLVDPVISMDEAIELFEQGKKVFVQEVAEELLPKKKVRIHSAWQNYREAEYQCSDCKKSWLGADLQHDFEGSVLGLRCPDCDRKLRNLSVEATFAQIEEFAGEGSTEAIEYLKMLAARSDEEKVEKESE
jgi:DNA-directed RNA polymerase subunit RPC12/RpoP